MGVDFGRRAGRVMLQPDLFDHFILLIFLCVRRSSVPVTERAGCGASTSWYSTPYILRARHQGRDEEHVSGVDFSRQGTYFWDPNHHFWGIEVGLDPGKSQLSRVRLITLDLDDTLWPVRSVTEHAETRLHSWLETHCPATAARYCSSKLNLLHHEIARSQPELANDYAALRQASLRLALRRSGDPEKHAEDAFAVFWAARHEIQCYEDVLPAMDRLASRYTLAAITNGAADIHRTPLAAYFDFSLGGSETGHFKPARQIFRLACARAGVKPEEALHAGDDIDCDVRGALSVGMNAAWINRDIRALRMLSPPAITVPDLGALADRLAA